MHTQADKMVLAGRLLTDHEFHQAGGQLTQLEQVIQLPAIQGEVGSFICQRCSNQNQALFAKIPSSSLFNLEEKVYCTACLQMGRSCQGDCLYYHPSVNQLTPSTDSSYLTWQGQLSPEQSRASQEVIASLEELDKPHMIYAVTGAGKTEILFQPIDHVLQAGGRVAVVSPRVDVCRELAPRLKEAFNSVDQVLLYGGGDQYRWTPLVIATTHQMLRFQEAFDLLIVDEVDAFPYVGDPTLHYAVKRAIKSTGKLVYLTATPDDHLNQLVQSNQVSQSILPARYHGHPLPIPEFVWIGDWRQAIQKRNRRSIFWQSVTQFTAQDGVVLIFVPHIQLAEDLFSWLKEECPHLSYACVHSKDPKRKEKVQAVRDGDLTGLITTTILERGVTFTNCHVFIVGSEDRLFTRSSLVQMSGRVGRKWDYPKGQLIYGHYGLTRAMKEAREEIQTMNQRARQKGLIKDE
ncbi:DEAD/DEAH box helicase [Hutsoniella sourekii]|uniref:DEAD/DEAH box helicase n=1 Tax=Hutsoniella sourekii TaxID=87650 RepID=UPI0004B9DC4F|nr:DEAD/DEAH box helicase [Hutsoniella sourekii]